MSKIDLILLRTKLMVTLISQVVNIFYFSGSGYKKFKRGVVDVLYFLATIPILEN